MDYQYTINNLKPKKQAIPTAVTHNMNFKRLTLFLSISLLLGTISTSSYAALSAITAKTIKGTKPYLMLQDGTTKLTNVNELLGFTMPKQDGSAGREQIIYGGSNISVTAPTGMKFSDVSTLVTPNGGTVQSITSLTVQDEDGDTGSPTGSMLAVWKDGATVVTNLNQTLKPCGGPYTLELSIPTGTPIVVNTTYGNPRINNYGSHAAVTYTFTPNGQSICYLQPKSMQVYTKGDLKFPDGYNSEVFDTTKGFTKTSGFPKTGFQGAIFTLVGSGTDQSKFRCNTSSSAITLSTTSGYGDNCTVTYTAATKTAFGTPIINMEYNTTGTTWLPIDSFTIPTPSKWARGGAIQEYGNKSSLAASDSFAALNYCSGTTVTKDNATGTTTTDKTFRQTYLYRRDELTNSPQANTTEGSSTTLSESHFSRDADNTFMGNWGYVHNQYGTGSPWSADNRYWSAEIWHTVYQFFVDASGDISYYYPSYSITAVCRGE